MDNLLLYQDSSITVGDNSLLHMAFAVRHKLSGVALEDYPFPLSKTKQLHHRTKGMSTIFPSSQATDFKTLLLPKWNL